MKEPYGITFQDIEDVVATSATELEFPVKTPNNIAQLEIDYTITSYKKRSIDKTTQNVSSSKKILN